MTDKEMRDYGSNSKKSKALPPGESKPSTPEDDDKPREKKVEAVVTGKVKKRKESVGRRFVRQFGGDDAQSVGNFIVVDVIIPAIKDMVYDAFSQGLERTLFGSSSGGGRRPSRGGGSSGNARTRYDKKYPGRDFEGNEKRHLSRRERSNHQFDSIVIESRGEAEEALEKLRGLVEQYDVATVNDLYDLVDITGDYTDEKWGWTNLRDSGVRRVRDGYLLDLPAPEYLD